MTGCGNTSNASSMNETRNQVLDSLSAELIEPGSNEPIHAETEENAESVQEESVSEVQQEEPALAVWAAYWDLNTAKEELMAVEQDVDTICHFAAYFDSDHKPFVPEKTVEYSKWQRQNELVKDMESYLTFVNDIKLTEGSSLKDTELLYELFETSESTKAHAAQILEMTLQGGYDGIEIDYEAIRKDIELWNLFINFIKELFAQAQEANVKVRVLLEPNVPIEELTFPEGPEYVMMCYNLHGYGTKPGPKADTDFLYEMVDVMEQLPGTINFALATGGFDFAEDNSVVQVTITQAYQLQKIAVSEIKRDEDSSALYFDYIDDSGMKHQVWYADEKTLEAWMNVIRAEGHERFTIWRLGSNIELK